MNDKLELQHEKIAAVQTVKHKLLDSGSVNFTYLTSLLEAHQLSESEKSDLAGAFMSKIQVTFEH
jgi:mannitol/fructose-specific phosphotransferase system IIA component